MGKSLVAWLVVAGAMATPAGPRDVVQTAVSRVITAMQQDSGREHARAEIRKAAASHRAVYDVLMDGVSFVATYRSEFERIIQQSSWSGLMDKLRKRAIRTTLVDRAPRMVSTPR